MSRPTRDCHCISGIFGKVAGKGGGDTEVIVIRFPPLLSAPNIKTKL